MANTYYDDLMVSRNASLEAINAAYKILEQKYNSDNNKNDVEASRNWNIINASYQTLSNPILRAEYDKWLKEQANNYQNFSMRQKNPNNISMAQNNIFAGFWNRFFAFSFDQIFLCIYAVVFIFLWNRSENYIDDATFTSLSTILWWLYFSCMESSKYQATLGKMVFGIKVINLEGDKISFSQALMRQFFKITPIPFKPQEKA